MSTSLAELDYSFHMDDENPVFEDWMIDPEVMAELYAIDAIYKGVDQ